jgi:hypothetical protein
MIQCQKGVKAFVKDNVVFRYCGVHSLNQDNYNSGNRELGDCGNWVLGPGVGYCGRQLTQEE